ncbi:MAG: DUF4398 domain-containing protein [Methylobacter sp.]
MKKFYRFDSSYLMMCGVSGILVVATLAGCANSAAPTEQIEASIAAVNNAKNAGGEKFAPQQFKFAAQKLEAAERAMAQKDYRHARQLAEQTQVDAQLAAVMARSVKVHKTVRELQENNRALQQEIERNAQ